MSWDDFETLLGGYEIDDLETPARAPEDFALALLMSAQRQLHQQSAAREHHGRHAPAPRCKCGRKVSS